MLIPFARHQLGSGMLRAPLPVPSAAAADAGAALLPSSWHGDATADWAAMFTVDDCTATSSNSSTGVLGGAEVNGLFQGPPLLPERPEQLPMLRSRSQTQLQHAPGAPAPTAVGAAGQPVLDRSLGLSFGSLPDLQADELDELFRWSADAELPLAWPAEDPCKTLLGPPEASPPHLITPAQLRPQQAAPAPLECTTPLCAPPLPPPLPQPAGPVGLACSGDRASAGSRGGASQQQQGDCSPAPATPPPPPPAAAPDAAREQGLVLRRRPAGDRQRG